MPTHAKNAISIFANSTRLLLVGCLLCYLAACNEADFKDKPSQDNKKTSEPIGQNNTPKNGDVKDDDDNGKDGLGEGEDDAGKCDLESDKVKLKYPEEISKCIDSEKLWNFANGGCSKISEAKSYDCSWSGLTSGVSGLGISTDILEKIQKDKGKLIGCGEKRDGKTLVMQAWYPPKGFKGCKYTSGLGVITACFEKHESTENPWAGMSEQEIVIKCMTP